VAFVVYEGQISELFEQHQIHRKHTDQLDWLCLLLQDILLAVVLVIAGIQVNGCIEQLFYFG